MRYGLSEQCIADMQEVFQRRPRIKCVWIFGSRAIGNYRPGSDIDFAILGDKLTFDDVLELQLAFDGLPYAYTYDILLYDQLATPSVKSHIDEFGTPFYQRPSIAGWQAMKWGEAAELQSGAKLPHPAQAEGKVPVFGAKGKTGYTDAPLCNYATVVIGKGAPNHSMYFAKTPFFATEDAYYLKPKIAHLDPAYAYYQLLSQCLSVTAAGAILPSTSEDGFYRLEVYLPPLKVQQGFAEALSALDAQMELNQQINQTLKTVLCNILHQYPFHFNLFPEPDQHPELLEQIPLQALVAKLGRYLNKWPLPKSPLLTSNTEELAGLILPVLDYARSNAAQSTTLKQLQAFLLRGIVTHTVRGL